jgi:hypothetical protein
MMRGNIFFLQAFYTFISFLVYKYVPKKLLWNLKYWILG